MWDREWLVIEDGEGRRIPGFDWLLEIPKSARTTLLQIVDAVRTTGPDQWRDRVTHTPMRAQVDHVHEARDKHGQTLYRLFLRWQRDERRVVVLDGKSKPVNTALPESDYDVIEKLADLADAGSTAFATEDDFAAKMIKMVDEAEDEG